jgi:putative membrane protein
MTMFALGWGGLGLSALLTVLFWVAIITLGVWIVGDLAAGRVSHVPAESASEILRQRYARGEISRTDYETLRRDLEK